MVNDSAIIKKIVTRLSLKFRTLPSTTRVVVQIAKNRRSLLFNGLGKIILILILAKLQAASSV